MRYLCVHCEQGTCVYGQRNRRCKGNHKGHRYYKPPLPWYRVVLRETAMKKPVAATMRADGAKPEVCDLGERWPSLWEFMTATEWDDKSRRAVGTILVMFEEGTWKVMLNDKALGRLAFVSGPSWEAAMNKADDAVRTDEADWRKAKAWKK